MNKILDNMKMKGVYLLMRFYFYCIKTLIIATIITPIKKASCDCLIDSDIFIISYFAFVPTHKSTKCFALPPKL